MSTPVDAAVRARALDPHASFIVQAPAGSGKTELLTQRLLVLLARVDEPEELVAITFTRKAAAEMRARVFRAIADVASGLAPQNAHQQQTYALAAAVLALSTQRGWQLEHNPQRLRVMTIDALCMQITQQMPLTAGFGGRVQIADEPRTLYRAAARATLDALEVDGSHRASLQRVLRHFDNRLGVLEEQIVTQLACRDQWLNLATESARAARDELEASLAGIVDEALASADAAIGAAQRRAWLASALHASEQLAATQPEHAIHRLRDGVWPGAACGADALSRWQALLDLVLTKDKTWRKKIDASNGFPAPKKNQAEPAALGVPRDAHRALIDELAATPGVLDALLRLRQLPAPRYDEAQWDVLQALLDVLRLAAGQLSLIFAGRGAVDFSEVAARAVAALGSDEAPTDLALALDYRLRHLLVDEFQDTSLMQYQLLRRLTAGWQPHDGRTLFVVGDPMQSIYRFREADVGLYLQACAQGLGGLPLEPLRLVCNFRSEGGIVDWVNEVFSRVLPAQDETRRGAVRHSHAVAIHAPGSGPAVQVHAQFDADAAAEAAQVLQLISEARAADAEGSIAVLVRSRTHLDALMPALRAAGLRYRAVDLESLASRPVIEDLRALTRALLQPMDRVAWLAVLRAPYCGLTLADLLVLAGDLHREQPLLTALHDEQRLAGLSSDGRQRLTCAMTVLDATLAAQGRRPLRRWVESTWVALGGPAAVRAPRDLADAQVFFAELEALAPGATLDDPEALDLALRDLKATPDPEADGRLSLMTIHKSKGLEFDTVIVPGLGRKTRSDTPPPIVASRSSGAGSEAELLLAPVHARGDESDPTYDYLRALEAEKQLFEDGRLLYVAATRARRRLHLLGSVGRDNEGAPREPPPTSLLARLWPAVAAQFHAAAAGHAPIPASTLPPESPPPPLRRLLAGWTAPPQAPDLPAAHPLSETANAALGASPVFDWAGEVARAVGVVFHRWAEQIGSGELGQWPASRIGALDAGLADELLAAGVPASRCAAAAALVSTALQGLLDDPRGRWLFDAQHREARSEWALTAMLDGRSQRLVIDRSFIDTDGTRWVVDFKTSRHEGGDLDGFLRAERRRYERQLQTYVSVLRRYGPEPVRAALYLPLIDAVEQRWQPLDLQA